MLHRVFACPPKAVSMAPALPNTVSNKYLMITEINAAPWPAPLRASDLPRRLVFPHAQKCRLAKQSLVRPIIEFHLHDHFRPHPAHIAPSHAAR